jgi:hypothetical protein
MILAVATDQEHSGWKDISGHFYITSAFGTHGTPAILVGGGYACTSDWTQDIVVRPVINHWAAPLFWLLLVLWRNSSVQVAERVKPLFIFYGINQSKLLGLMRNCATIGQRKAFPCPMQGKAFPRLIIA